MCSLYLAVLIQHYGLKIHPRCYNTAVHSFSLPYSIMFHEYATIYFSISTVDKPLRCFHLFPIMKCCCVHSHTCLPEHNMHIFL